MHRIVLASLGLFVLRDCDVAGVRPSGKPIAGTWGGDDAGLIVGRHQPPRPSLTISAMLACPRCGGRMRLIATIEDPQVIRKILAHLGLSTEIPLREPPAAVIALE